MGATTRRRQRTWLLQALFVLGSFAAAGLVAAGVVSGADQPSISSERSDYAPGDAVALSGAGWQAGEAVQILVDDDQDDPWSRAAELTAAADGTVADSFDLPDVAGEFSITATSSSGTASSTFAVTAPTPPPPAPTGTPTLDSDAEAYEPSATVTLSGAEWQPGDSVRVVVDDDAGDAWDHSADASVAADGTIAETFDLPDDLVAGFTAVVTDPAERSATATFETASDGLGAATEPHLVRFAPGTSTETQSQILAAAGAEDMSYIAPLRIHGVLLPGGAGLQTSIDALRSNPSVTRVEPDRTREAGGTPNDSSYGDQWSLPKIGWENAFGEVSVNGTAKVAILDTGIDGSHPDLDGNVVSGTSILDGSNGLSDPNGHGTAMAGIVAAETGNGAGIAGVGYAGVQVMPVTVLDADGTGQDSDIIEGVVYAADNGADVILMAFSNPGYSEMLQAAIDYAWDEGAVLVAATGNDGSSAVTFPAGDRGVIGVSNTDPSDALNGSSNHGQAVFLGAPGTAIATTATGGGYATITGTSASAAEVAGAAALLRAAAGASNGVVVARLAKNAEAAGSQSQTGNGRLNLDRAMTDTSTGAIQPAGAAPVGGGGPFVGPYVAAANSFNVAPPAQSVAAASTQDYTWTFTAQNSANVATTTFTVPALWTPPASVAGPGQILVTAGTCAASLNSVNSVTGVVTINQQSGGCNNNQTFTLTYKNATAPTPASPPQTYTFVNQHGQDPAVTVTAPVNAAPTVAFVLPPATANEGQTRTYNFTITDPDVGNTFTFVSGFPTCGSGNTVVSGSASIDSVAKTGTFQCSFADGATTPSVQVRVQDNSNAPSNTAAQTVSVANVPPTIAISGAASVNEGSSYSVTLGAVSDPGADTVSSYVVHWGDGATDTYSSAGVKTHTYADGLATRAITVDLVDEDGTHADRANALSVQVDNVAPSIAISGGASVGEGSSYSLALGTVTDPGNDTITGYVVHWGDGASDTYGSAGLKTHTYPDGPATHSITVDLVDEDDTHLNRANPLSVTVSNVAPALTAPANQTASEGTAKLFDLGSFTDPGDDDPWEVTVDWGDGSSDTVFNEGAPGAIADKTHTYADDGAFTVTVTVDEDAGAGVSDSATFQVTVANVAPVVTAPANQTAGEGSSSSFALGSFTDPGDDDPWEVTVDWGDGSADTVFNEGAAGAIAAKTHTYADDGSFTVTVTVDEDAGAGVSDFATFQVVVANVPPAVTPPADQTASEGTGKSFSLGSFTDPGDDDPWEVTVDWGDGSTDTVFNEGAAGAIAAKTHTYADDGSFTVTVTVDEDAGAGVSDFATFQVVVANVPPVVTAPGAQTADEATAKLFDLSSFTDPGDDDPWEVTVDWGDGSLDTVFTETAPGTIADKTHTYADDGAFTVTVTVDEDAGAGVSDSATFQVTVANLPPVISNVAAESPIDESDSSTVTITASDPAGVNDPLTYEFDCDGNGVFEVGPQMSNTHDCFFADNGTFTVDVRVTDGDGGADTGSDTVVVQNVAPIVTAPANQTASEGTAKLFDLGSFTDPGDDDPWEVTVDWGDGSSDTVFNEGAPGAIADKTHTYADDGAFTVTVTVDEDAGAGVSDSATFQVTVANVAPVVTAPANQTASEGSSSSFALGSFTDPGDDDPWEVTVDWGDGSADTVFNEGAAGAIAAKTHTYADDGSFTVTVTVDEDAGAGVSDFATFQVVVANVPPAVTPPADQTASEGTGKSFSLGSFTDPGDDDPWEVTVDWGDGSTDTVFNEGAAGAIAAKTHTYADDGSFTVTVTVDEDAGAGVSDFATFQVVVANVAPTVAKPTFQPVLIACQTITTLTGISFSDPGINDNPWTVDIDWGDASPHTTYATATQGAQPNQSHTYSTPGPHTATVTVTDKDTDTGWNTSTAPVTVYQYTVDFLPPFDDSVPSGLIVNKMKNGRVVPVKARIRDECAGALVIGPGPDVTIKVSKTSGSGAGDPVEEYADAGDSNAGTDEFRPTSDHWIYNLDSKALGLVINNLYRVDVYVDGVKATVSSWAVLQPVK